MPTIKLRRDTAANWTSVNPVLNEGEMGLETDTNKLKIGDGYNTWSDRGYINTNTAYGTFNPSSTRSYTGTSASDGLGVKPIIAGDRNVIDNTGQGQIKIHTAETGSLERTIVSPNSGDANYVGWGGAGKLSADATFLATVEYEGSGVPSNALIHIHNLTTGALVNTVTRAIASTDYNGSEFNWGANIHLRGNYLLVSSSKGTAGGQTEAGSVQVYKTATGDWTDMALHGTVDNPSPAASDQWGDSISVLGEFALVGCPSKTVSSQANAGSVSVVHMENLTVVSTIDNPDAGDGDSFGSSVDFMTDYDHIAIGSEGDESGITGQNDVTTASIAASISVSGQTTQPEGLTFSTDGSKMFIAASSPKAIIEYTLGTPFSVATATHANTFSISALVDRGDGVCFNSDGTHMFVVGYNSDNIHQYALTTGFDTTTASHVRQLDISSYQTNPRDVQINSDGTRIFTISDSGSADKKDHIVEWYMTTPYDISTAYHVSSTSIAAQSNAPQGLAFNADGTKLYVVDEGDSGGTVYQYDLSAAYDSSTLSYASKSFVTGNGPTGVFIKSDGLKMYTCTNGDDSVSEYNMGNTVSSDNSGAVYIYKTTIGDWTDGSQVKRISNPNSNDSDPSDKFGSSVSSYGNYLAVAAKDEDNYAPGATGTVDYSQAAFSSVTFGQHQFSGNPVHSGDQMGTTSSISPDGNYVAGGFDSARVNGNQRGRVYILDGSNGSILHTLVHPTDTANESKFGKHVRVNNTYTAISAPYTIVGGQSRQGQVYVYENSTGNLTYTLSIPGGGAQKTFGMSLDIDETHLVIGTSSRYEGSNQVFLVDLSNGSFVWTSNGSSISAERHGCSVALTDSYVFAGHYKGSQSENRVYVLNRTNGSLLRTITSPSSDGTNGFGDLEHLTGTDSYLVASAPDDGTSNSGKVYVYNPSNGTLLRTISNPNRIGGTTDDKFGSSLDMKGDYIIAGSEGDGASAGGNEGSAYIIDASTGSTIKTFTSTTGNSGIFFGKSVGISSSGKVIVGAETEKGGSSPLNNQGSITIFSAPSGAPLGSSSGSNYIFKTTDGTWTDTALCSTLANPDTTPETADDDLLSGISLGNDRLLAGYAAAGSNQGTGKVEEYDLYE